jgi:hypothetical protein
MFKSYYYLVKVKVNRQFIYVPMTVDFKLVTDFKRQKPNGNNLLNLLLQLWFQPQVPDEFFRVPIHQQGYELGSNQNLSMSCLKAYSRSDLFFFKY